MLPKEKGIKSKRAIRSADCGFFRNLVFLAEEDVFASQAAQDVCCGALAYGSSAYAAALRGLLTSFPEVKEIGANTEFFSEFRDGPANGEQLNGLGLKLGCVLLSWFAGIHGWILVFFGPAI